MERQQFADWHQLRDGIKHVKPIHAVAVLQMIKGNWFEAIDACRRVLDIDPEHLATKRLLLRVYAELW